jgi:hypothetical protein
MEKEKDHLIKDIESTFGRLIGQLSDFNVETLNKVPFEGSWTAGQTAEHIIICGSGIPDSQTTEVTRRYDEKVATIKKMFLNFEVKFETDPSIAPGPPPHDLDKTIQKIREIRDHLKTVAANADLEALCEDMELPTFGLLTRYEWLRFILFHTQRHTHQITGIKSIISN